MADANMSEEERQLQEALALSMQSMAPAPPPSAPAEDDEERQMQEALALSMQQSQPASSDGDGGDGGIDIGMLYADADAGGPSLARLIFGDAIGEVMRQWRSQGLILADVDLSDAPGITPFSAGLAQDLGGPCAVLAAAQAFMLRRLLFDPSPDAPQPAPEWLEEAPQGDGSLLPSEAEAHEALLRGIADILCACACAAEPTAAGASASTAPTPEALASCAVVVAIPTPSLLDSGGVEGARESLLASLTSAAAKPVGWHATLEALRARSAGLASPIGALGLLTSAVLTRGVLRFCKERDDASMPLLDPQFGHCSQDALNLMLVGVGTSNLFDGSRDLGGGFVLRGVPRRPPVGLLSQLEALRYLEVGTHFKQPSHPIWVVASESHYSLLFATTNAVQATDAVAQLEERLLAAFNEFDREGNGFISVDHLPALLSALPQWKTPAADELKPRLDPDRTSLVVWADFHKMVMPMHPDAAEHIALQASQEAEQQKAQGFSAPASQQRGTASECQMFHYNGLGARGHENKRALRQIAMLPGGAAGQPAGQGLAACIATRWKDALVTHEGPAPSIN